MNMPSCSGVGVRISFSAKASQKSSSPIELSGRILGLAFEDNEDKTDQITLQIANEDLKLWDHPQLQGGSILEIAWGYPTCMSAPRRMVIKKLRGYTTLTITGDALSTLLNESTRNQSWRQMRRSDVARAIATRYNYTGPTAHIGNTAEIIDTIHQAGETDAAFLRRLARAEGFVFYIDGSGFHWHAQRNTASPARIWTPSNILEVRDVEMNWRPFAKRVVVRGRDPLTRSTVEAIAEHQEIDGDSTATYTASATSSLPDMAQRVLQRRLPERIRIALQVVGDPFLRAKEHVDLRLNSKTISGLYAITQVKHNVASTGYTCDVGLVKIGPSTGQDASPSPLPIIEWTDLGTGESRKGYGSAPHTFSAADPESGVA